MREKYESLPVASLRDIAKARHLKGVSTMKKADIIELMLAEDEKDKAKAVKEEVKNEKSKEGTTDIEQLDSGITVSGIIEVMPDGYGFIRSNHYLPGENDVYVSPSQIRRFGLKTGDILEGNTRVKTQTEKFSALLYLTKINGQVPVEASKRTNFRRFGLKTGDILEGNTRVKTQTEKFSALLYLTKINGQVPVEASKRTNFEDMTPIFPNERLKLEGEGSSVAMRIVDLLSPIGKGQRGMIVSPPKAGKTTLLKETALSILRNNPEMNLIILFVDLLSPIGKGQRGMIVSPPKAGKTTLLKETALSILRNNPEMNLIILLIDERPEEVTDIKEAITGPNVEVVYSTFDELPEHHKRVSEMVIERSMSVRKKLRILKKQLQVQM